MQEKAGKGTFGGTFGGRKSLQSRKSGRFGGTFGGRNSQTETKLMHVRRHLRRPKVSDRAETPTFGGKLRQPKAASQAMFGGRNSLRLPNLVSAKGQKLGSSCPFQPPTQPIMHNPILQHAYSSIQAPRGFKLS